MTIQRNPPSGGATIPTGYLRVSITDVCNMACRYCHNEGQRGVRNRYMSEDVLRFILRNAQRFGLRKVRLTGGEPLLHPKCGELLAIAKRELAIPTVGFNTNATDRQQLIRLVEAGLIDKLVVGLDYVNAECSKDSPLGLSSQEVLETVLATKARGQDVSIACVFDGEEARVEALAGWCLDHRVDLKVLERTDGSIRASDDEAFGSMSARLISHHALLKSSLREVRDCYGQDARGTKIFFFHSHCPMRECTLCGSIHMRVTADGFIKTCIQEGVAFPLLTGDFDTNMRRAIDNVGLPPEERR